jgi:hypothetical protein
VPATQSNFFKKLNLNLDDHANRNPLNLDFKEFLAISKIYSLNAYFYSNFYNEFLYDYFSIDGIFIFKLVSKNFGETVASQLIHEIIIKYLDTSVRKNKDFYFNTIFREQSKKRKKKKENDFKNFSDSDFI